MLSGETPGRMAAPARRLPGSGLPVMAACAAAALVAAANAASGRLPGRPFPGPEAMRFSRQDAVQNGTLLSLGMRRLAADLTFLQLLMYYGTPPDEAGPAPAVHGHDGHAGHRHEDHARRGHEPHGGAHGPPPDRWRRSGNYPELRERGRRVLDLDPFFSHAAAFVAGALAFNENRPDEALDLLELASRRDPGQWQHKALAAGIAFHQKGDAEQVLRMLTPVLSQPGCPTLLKNILAFLNRRLGRSAEAARIYQDILATGDPAYHAVARRALAELDGQGPVKEQAARPPVP